YFFGKNGLPKLFFSPWGIDPAPKSDSLWLHQGANLARLLSSRFGSNKAWHFAAHGPMLFDKFALTLVQSLWKEQAAETSSHQFREVSDLLPHPLYANTLAALDAEANKPQTGRHEIETLDESELRVVSVGDPALPWRQDLDKQSSSPARFFCLNDNVPAEIADAVDFSEIEKAHKSFLETLFPAPSAHERRLYVFWKKLQNRIRSCLPYILEAHRYAAQRPSFHEERQKTVTETPI